MNTSQPVPSSIQDVTFGFLAAEDVKKLSVKRITNTIALDPLLLHQVPGGLYDPALGAFGQTNCGTCHLNSNSCPGHCGHIELPVRVYHCTYMPQAYRLLRAQCLFCHKLRLSRVEVNKYWCKLRLLRFGLLNESDEIDIIGIKKDGSNAEENASSESEDEETSNIIEKRTAFVNKALRKRDFKKLNNKVITSEAIVEARQSIVAEFHSALLKARKCANCKAISPQYRKDKFRSIFRKPLTNKDRQNNLKNGFKKPPNPLTEFQKQQRRQKQIRLLEQRKAEAKEQEDEGVADMEGFSSNENLEEPEILDTISDEMATEDEEGPSEALVDDETGLASKLDTQASMSQKQNAEEDQPRQAYVNPNEVHASLSHLFDREAQIFSEIYNSSHLAKNLTRPSADMFFVTHLIVTPTKYRREMRTGPNEITENPDNEPYRKIIGDCDEMFAILKEIQGKGDPIRRSVRNFDDLQNVWLRLQDDVNSLFDTDRNPASGPMAKRVSQGIKQKFEKKEGLFRMNVMGKRVNFAARSVISPDPNIETNEVGVPPVFAIKLSYPEPVTHHNYNELKQAVINGPFKWPGAMAVEMENGQVINLRIKSDDERVAVANLLLAPSSTTLSGARNKKVHRHLKNGDIVIMNRQPTLHKPSMMAHRVKILQGEKTIRMHYANCNTYNADFDGDEMNLHFLQNEIARAEAMQVADTDHQYLSATAGKPLRGLIQDHISMGVWLTCQDSFFTREQYQEILYAALRPEHGHTSTNRILTVEPMILKPTLCWTGKQIITTILLNIRPESHDHLTFESNSGTPKDSWFPSSEEGVARVLEGELLTGILDKKQIGPSSGGLVHCVYEAYGPRVAGRLLGILGRLFNKLLNIRGFSCGVEDLIMTKEGETARSNLVIEADTIGLPVASRYVLMEDEQPQANDPQLRLRLEEVLRDDEKQTGLDAVMNSRSKQLSTEITMACLPDGLIKPFPKNQMQSMTTSGAKGSQVNANLISCNLGQQVLEGRRVPVMVSGKTLPSFKPFEPSVRAGGYIIDRFLTGIRPQEYFFHAMAGREGLIDTAVKTSRSGYLQRCVVKGLEGLRAEHDTSVRDSDGTVIQTLYGEDGLDITKSQALNDFAFAGRNFMSLFASLDARRTLDASKSKEAAEWNKAAIKSVEAAEQDDTTTDHQVDDPALSLYSPGRYAGSTSETFFKAVRHYAKMNPHKKLRDKAKGVQSSVSKNSFTDVMHLNYLRSVVDPGEAVGVIAGQSLGEPSTQMTLNTFHLAGHSAKNVTLGIPRLREILMTASQNLKTPTMSLFPLSDLPHDHAEKFAKSISRVSLADIVDDIQVTESVGKGIYQPESRIYKIEFEFYPAEEYTEQHNMQINDVAVNIEHEFLPTLRKRFRAEIKRRGEEKVFKAGVKSDALPELGQSDGRVEEQPMRPDDDTQLEGGDSDRDDGGDDDAADAKRRRNADEGVTYDDPESSDEELAERVDEAEDSDAQSEDETYGGSPRSSGEPETPSSSARKSAAQMITEERASRIVDRFSEVTAFSFPTSGKSCTITLQFPTNAAKILMLPLLISSAKATLITHIPSVATCTLIEEDGVWNPYTQRREKQSYIHTEGVNLLAMRDYTTPYRNILDPTRIGTNDIGAMLRIYGVEAARSCIIKELKAVFDSHSISVDYRHLSLIADYMTRGGGFRAFNRMGMSDSPDLFKKMSFETTVNFISQSTLGGETDRLDGPSSRITVGALSKMGTGAFDVLVPMDGQGIIEEE